jgi:hypothetical protein
VKAQTRALGTGKMRMMRRILYISTVTTALSSKNVEDILRVSRRNNGAAGVTGLLVIGGRRCLQALEGPPDAVGQTFERIGKDPRHFAIVTLNDKPIDAPAFGDWSMGFQAGGDPSSAKSLEDQIAAILAPIDDANLRAYFSGFAVRHGA